ncbi:MULTISPECIES: GNAT family N-acetyltransferase [Ensifer]|nr:MULTISPECIES: GNAT family N-acetyltransferase [Ensifer]NOV18613.1 GNAT family N-acetyltransferase [Ensifer canadensis]
MQHPGRVRPMELGDIPAVSSLFSKIFRKRDIEPSGDLRQYLEAVFFGSPLYSPEHGSIVYDDGTIASAILALPMEFSIRGRHTVGKLLCAFMSDGKAGAVGAACLARTMRSARQDMCFSDNSSPVSADHWVAGGGVVLPIQSLEWQRSFRPATSSAIRASRQFPALGSKLVLGVLGAFDRVLRWRRPSVKPTPASGCMTKVIGAGEFLGCARPMMERFSVRPVWSTEEFDWLVAIAGKNQGLGEVHFRQVTADGRAIGVFLFLGRANRTATVLNVLCQPGREFEVTAEMFACLDREGYAQATGAAQPFLMNAISRQRWLTFRHRGYFCMVTRHGDLKDAALRNDLYIGGLASESWSRLLTDF